MKKLLALVLALVMTLSLCVTSNAAYAGEEFDYKEAVDVMTAVGVFQGDQNGKFNPDGILTREQAAKIVTYMLLGKKAADALVTIAAPFADVEATRWSAGSIAYCYNEGILAGVGEGKFAPTAELTGLAFAKMMLTALGYDAEVEGLVGANWSINTAKLALTVGLTDDLDDVSLSAPMTREQAAQMAFNTELATLVEYNNNSTITAGNVTIKTQTAAEPVDTNSLKGNLACGDNTVVEFAEKYCTKLSANVGAHDDFGRPATSWKYDKEDVGTYADKADYVVVLDDTYTTNAKFIGALRDLTDNDDLALIGSTAYTLDGDANTKAGVVTAADIGEIVELYTNDNDQITDVVAYSYVLDQIDEVDDELTAAEIKADHTYEITTENSLVLFDDEFAGFDAKTYVEDAYVAVVYKASTDEVIASFIPETVEGAVGTVKSTDYVTVAGTKYEVSATYSNGSESLTMSSISTKADDSYTLFLDANGYVIGIKEVKATAPALDEVYIVDNIWTDTINVAGNASVPVYYAQLVAMDGTVKEIELESKDKNDVTGADVLGDATYYNDYYSNRTAYEKELVTISDKKWTESTNTYKAGNDKFDLALWGNAVNDDFDVYTAVTVNPATELAKDDTRVNATGASLNGAGSASVTYRLNDKTQYVFVKGTTNTLDTKVVTGGVAYDLGTKATDITVITEDDSKVALYVIIETTDMDQNSDYSDDVIFINTASSEKGDGYRLQTVYTAAGDKETWKIDESEYTSGALISNPKAFFEYEENDDGYIELNRAAEITVPAGGFVWDDEEGTLLNVRVDDENDLFDNLLTVKKGAKYVEDIDVTNAAFVDAHDTDGANQYEKTISSLTRLMNLIENGKVDAANTALYLSITEDGATTIVLLTAKAL